MMKKSVKMVVALMLAFVMIAVSQECTLAGTKSWSATKSPGQTGAASTIVNMPLYKGKITYKVTSLSGGCSYLVGKCVSYDNDYYIDNAARSVSVSQVGGQDSFYLYFWDSSSDLMYFKCTVENNASTGDTVSGTGTISY